MNEKLQEFTLADCLLLNTVGLQVVLNDGKVMGFLDKKGTPQTLEVETALGKSK